MTETEWLACTEPRALLKAASGKVSARKLRLLVCACCRRVWDLLLDDRSKEAVEVSEQYADGTADDAALASARRNANAAYQRARKQHGPQAFRHFGAAHLALQATAQRVRFDPHDNEFLQGAAERKDKTERKARSELIRDLFGPLLFRAASVDPAWVSSTVSALARNIHEEGGFKQLPILADALEEAGCTDTAILSHCRLPGVHVKGCWVVDLLTRQEGERH
jgi:hypothetical protein